MTVRNSLMKALLGVAIASGVLATPRVASAAVPSAAEIAMGAFFSLEESPFAPGTIEKALADVKRAALLDGKEAWVYIATSRLSLQLGYRSGDQFETESYDTDALKRALAHAERAVQLEPRMIAALTHLARVQMLLRNWLRAVDLLSEATVVDAPNRDKDFYVSFLNSVIVRLQQSYVGGAMLDDADGNYGSFLLWLRRYEEAVVQLEKAMSIAPYGMARDELARARLLRDASRK